MKKNNIFISYRRDGGEYTARILHDKLTQLGYRVFYDIESMKSGDFDDRLYKVIEECEDFLVILSPGAFDIENNKEPWIIREVAYALEHDKNIIPVMIRNFDFPEQMPAEIEQLRYKNGLPADTQFFGAFIEKLEEFLQSNPNKMIRFKKVMPVVIAAVLIVLAVLAAAAWNNSTLFPYPRNNTEKNLTNDLLYYIELNLLQIDQMAECMNEVYDTCERQLTYEDETPESLEQIMRQYRSVLYQMDMEEGTLSSELADALQDSPFSAAEITVLYDLKTSFQDEFINNIYYLEYLIGNETLDKSTRKEVMDSYRSLTNEEMKVLAYGANIVLLPIRNESALEEFKKSFLPLLRYIPLTAADWSYDQKALESAENNCYENINKIVIQYSKLVGEDNMALIEEENRCVRLLVEQGYAVAEAEQLVEQIMMQTDAETEKLVALQEKAKELERTEEQLARAKEEIKEKFAPADGDSGDILWGKMLRFLNVKLYDDALGCLDAYRETMRAEDENVEQYTAAAARFIRNISNTGIEYGVLIVDYEFSETDSDPRRIGDVIIAVNNKPCHNVDEYTVLKEAFGDTEEYSIVVLRDSGDNSGTMEQIQLAIPAGSQRLYMRDMTEKTYD